MFFDYTCSKICFNENLKFWSKINCPMIYTRFNTGAYFEDVSIFKNVNCFKKNARDFLNKKVSSFVEMR